MLRHKNGVYLYSSKILKVLLKIQYIFGILLSLSVIGNFRGTCSSIAMLKGYIVRERFDRIWSCAQTLPICKNASAPVAIESEKSKQFMLAVFSKSLVLRTKVSFNKSKVIALWVLFARQFCLTDVTLHLRSPLHCRASFITFGLITSSGSGTAGGTHELCPLPVKETIVFSCSLRTDQLQ